MRDIEDLFKNSLIYNYTKIERATKTYTNASKNYYGYRDAINFVGEEVYPWCKESDISLKGWKQKVLNV